MFVVADEVLSTLINNALQSLKSDQTVLDRVFMNARDSVRAELKNYIAQNSIQVTRGYPQDPTRLPAYVIVLGSEREETEAFGSFLGDEDDYTEITTYTETVKIQTSGTFTGFTVTHRPIQNIVQILYGGIDQTAGGSIIDAQHGTVSFGTPDMNSKTATVQYQAITTSMELYGTLMNSQYRIESWSNNGDLTVLMYHLLKWIVLSNRDALYTNGLFRVTIGGTDFEPVQLPTPLNIYRRALTIDMSSEARWEQKYNFISTIHSSMNMTT